MSKKINPIRRINWFLMKKFGFGFKRDYPFRTSAIIVKNNLGKQAGLICVEIGTHKGESAEYFLKTIKNIKKFYCIDPYEPNWLADGKKAPFHLEHAKKRLKKFKEKVVFIRKKSDDALTDIPEKVDYVYIDGMKENNQVKKDMKNYFPFIKKGGIMAGHDINNNDVAKQVFEFCSKTNRVPIIKEMDWIIIKN